MNKIITFVVLNFVCSTYSKALADNVEFWVDR